MLGDVVPTEEMMVVFTDMTASLKSGQMALNDATPEYVVVVCPGLRFKWVVVIARVQHVST